MRKSRSGEEAVEKLIADCVDIDLDYSFVAKKIDLSVYEKPRKPFGKRFAIATASTLATFAVVAAIVIPTIVRNVGTKNDTAIVYRNADAGLGTNETKNYEGGYNYGGSAQINGAAQGDFVGEREQGLANVSVADGSIHGNMGGASAPNEGLKQTYSSGKLSRNSGGVRIVVSDEEYYAVSESVEVFDDNGDALILEEITEKAEVLFLVGEDGKVCVIIKK